MSKLVIEVETAKAAMSEIRPALDAALHQHFPGGMLQRRWEEDVLHLWGPGAQATVQLVDGRLVGRAELRPPASLLRSLIEEKVSAALRSVAG